MLVNRRSILDLLQAAATPWKRAGETYSTRKLHSCLLLQILWGRPRRSGAAHISGFGKQSGPYLPF